MLRLRLRYKYKYEITSTSEYAYEYDMSMELLLLLSGCEKFPGESKLEYGVMDELKLGGVFALFARRFQLEPSFLRGNLKFESRFGLL